MPIVVSSSLPVDPATRELPAAAGPGGGRGRGHGRGRGRGDERDRQSPRKGRRRTVVGVVVVLALLVAFLGAWAYDSSKTAGGVARGVTVAGRPVGGMSPSELASSVDAVAAAYRPAAVTIHTPKGDFSTTAEAVGLTLDTAATQQAALEVDDATTALGRPFRWAASLFSSRPAPLVFTVDPGQLRTGIEPAAAANRVEPTNPSITADDQGVEVVAGVPGQGLDETVLARQLAQAAASGTTPIEVAIAPTPVAPRFSDADAQALAADANKITHTPLNLSVGGKSATIQTRTVRSWLRAEPTQDGLQLAIDGDKVTADLAPLIGDLGSKPVDASFTVDGDPKAGAVSIVDGAPGTVCCGPDTPARILEGLRTGATTVSLETVQTSPAHDRAWAEGLQIVEPVASFTTNHAAGEARVTNIHRIADLARGMVIEPGQTFSVNERIGQRTEEKGFVDAGVIYEGKHTTDIGGGVSQFATTLFNAAFFGGLDLVDYQSHTEYISRYPFGREATISWPKPDLKIKNNTPYGILIWPSYTDTSVTITLYSTKFVSGDQTGQTKTPDGDCDKITTERTRTWVDGHQEKDSVIARYARQADAGITCW